MEDEFQRVVNELVAMGRQTIYIYPAVPLFMQTPSGLKLLRVNEGLVRGYILVLKLIAINHSTVSTYIL